MLVMSGCAGAEGDVLETLTTTTTVTEPAPEPTTVSLLDEAGEAAYRIILPENRTEVEASPIIAVPI